MKLGDRLKKAIRGRDARTRELAADEKKKARTYKRLKGEMGRALKAYRRNQTPELLKAYRIARGRAHDAHTAYLTAHAVSGASAKKLAAWRSELADYRAKLSAAASNGLWGGSRYWTNRAVKIGDRFGAPVMSRKRTEALNGNTASDHNTWNRTADAVDLGTFSGADLAHAIARDFGIAGYSTGNYNSYFVRRNGVTYRVQILWAVEGHFNHVHVGVRRV